MTDHAAAIEAISDRISLPDVLPVATDPTVTGELRDLLAWWNSLDGMRAVNVSDVDVTADPGIACAEALLAGAAAADRAIDSGATLLVPHMSQRDARSARIVIAVLARTEAPVVVAQPEGMPDREWMAAVADVRDQCARLGSMRAETMALLDDLQAPALAFCAGVLLAAAARRTACIVDGTDEHAAALVADRVSTRAKAWWTAGSRSSDLARQAAVDRIGLREGLPLALADESGWGARSTISLLHLLVGTTLDE